MTLASRRVFLSQSATSSALRRLRETFNDPILVRRGKHMVASPKAVLIQAELTAALAILGGVIAELQSGDPLEAGLSFTISSPEYVTLTLSDTIRTLLQPSERRTHIHLEPFARRTILDSLERGGVDLALGAFGRLKPQFRRTALYKESVIVVLRKGHPALTRHADGVLDVADFTGFPHLQVTAGEILEEAWISKLLSARAVERQVTAVLPNILLAPDVLRHTDLLCVGTQRSFASLAAYSDHLTFLKMPPELNAYDYDIEMVWHDRNDDDQDLAALRMRILESSASLRAG